MQLLNGQQEAFCQTYAAKQSGQTQTQVYLSVYNCSKKAAYVSASRLLKKAKIKARIKEILAENEPKLPLATLVARSLSESLEAKKVIRIKGGYIEVPHYAVRLRAIRMVSKFQGILK